MEKASEKAAPQPKIRKRKANQKVKKKKSFKLRDVSVFHSSARRHSGWSRDAQQSTAADQSGGGKQKATTFCFSFFLLVFLLFFRGSRPPPVTTTKTTVNNDSKRSQIRSNKEKKNVKPPFSASFFFDWSFFLGTSRFNVRRPRNSVKTR